MSIVFVKEKRAKVLSNDHLERGKLVRALGVGEWHLFCNGKKRIKKGDKFLLCSDGLYRNITLHEVKQWSQKPIYNDTEANRMLRQLWERKKNLKEKDNISALYFGYRKAENKEKL